MKRRARLGEIRLSFFEPPKISGRDSIGHRLVADLYRQTGRADKESLSLLLRSFSSQGVYVHDQARHTLFGGGSSTRYKSFGTVKNELLIALLLLTLALLVMSNLCSACQLYR